MTATGTTEDARLLELHAMVGAALIECGGALVSPARLLEELGNRGITVLRRETLRAMERATRDSGACRLCSGARPGYAEIVHRQCLDDAVAGQSAAEPDDGRFDQWAIVELFGHVRRAGRLTEQEVAGAGFLRLEIPGRNGAPGVTQFISPKAVYAITPTTEEIARDVAVRWQPQPVQPWELERPEPAKTADDQPDDDDEDGSDYGAGWGD